MCIRFLSKVSTVRRLNENDVLSPAETHGYCLVESDFLQFFLQLFYLAAASTWFACITAKRGANALGFELLIEISRVGQQVIIVKGQFDLERQKRNDTQGQEEND